MCARIFYLILAGLFAFVVATVAAFKYLDWWQAILASALTLLLLVFAARLLLRSFVGSMANLAKGLFETKSRVLRNASVDVHSVKPGSMPSEIAELLTQAETDEANGDDDDGPDPAEVERLRNNTRWYSVEATIFPDAAHAGAMMHWDLDDLRLIPFDAPVADFNTDETGEEYELHNFELVESGTAKSPEGSKLQGPQRLRFTVGVPPEQRSLKFRYYFEQFGRIDLPGSRLRGEP